jgi:hypothetical protein
MVGCLALCSGLSHAATLEIKGFRMRTDAQSGYVLTSDGSGNGTWEPIPGGGAAPHIHFGETWNGTSVYGLRINNGSASGYGFYGNSTAATGTGCGVAGECISSDGAGVYGRAPATGIHGYAYAPSGDTYGVYGQADTTSGTGHGVYGEAVSTGGRGVYGECIANGGAGVHGLGPNGNYGSLGTDGSGVYGYAPYAAAVGVEGQCADATSTAVRGYNRATTGSACGVEGWTDSPYGIGVYGEALATSGFSYGVYGAVNSPDGYSGYFTGGYGVWVSGKLHVTGELTKGGGSFRIDHPLDPENKYLLHSFVESPDMMNIYNGNVVLDAKGEAAVDLPEWFEALNRDFRYQLTCIGGFARIYIAEEIRGNRFTIAGGTPGMKVSWQVTGIRKDPYAKAHRIAVEQDKPPAERGTYLHAEAWGQPKEKSIARVRGGHTP